MATQCCNCGMEATPETAHGSAPACAECQRRWRDQAAADAIRTLLAQGYTVITPGGQTLQVGKQAQ